MAGVRPSFTSERAKLESPSGENKNPNKTIKIAVFIHSFTMDVIKIY